MTLLKEPENNSISFASVLLFLGLFGILANAMWQVKSAYSGERLVTKRCTLVKAPSYHGGGKVTPRYSFNVNEFSSEVWITGTAIEQFNKDGAGFNKFKAGDTVDIQVAESAIDFLNKHNNIVYVWGLTYKENQVINPERIEAHDRHRLHLIYVACIVSVIVGILLKIFKK